MTFSVPRERIPIFPLYGESGPWSVPEPMHCEALAARSALHDWDIRPHRHEDLCQLLFLRRGVAQVALDGVTRQIAGPGLIFVPARMVHGFRFSPGVDGEVVTLPAAVMNRLLGDAAPRGAAVMPLAGNAALIALAGEADYLAAALAREFVAPRRGRLAALESLLTLLFLVVARRMPPAPAGAPADPRIGRFYELLETSYDAHWPVARYAGRLNISAVRLNTLLRRATGRPALAIIHQRLMLEARRNLIYTTLRVGDIASLLGFADAGYFSRFFSRQAGVSPSAFRQRALDAINRAAI